VVDDVVILFADGHHVYVQTKKNQAEHSTWSLGDPLLREELLKAREQLEGDPRAKVCFYSQTPFGDLHRLADAARSYVDHPAFIAGESAARKTILARFAQLLERDPATALGLSKRIYFGPAHTQEEWDRHNLADLDRLVPNPALARDVLERLLGSHQANLRDVPLLLYKEDLISALAAKGLYPAPPYEDAETITAFHTASAMGREWIRNVDGERFQRPEVAALSVAIAEGHRNMVLTDIPGGGKTCVLLDLADQLEADPGTVLLFIKADLFAEAASEDDLRKMGLPTDIVGRCARLAQHRRVVVIFDSLDVLSLHRSHGSLKLFLGLLDRLQTIGGVRVVAACRDFDLQHDPLLRGRTWSRKVTVSPLDFDSQVAPLLSRWGLEPYHLAADLRTLLQIPQNLRIFEKVARNVTPGLKNVTSAYHLYERYLQDVVAADPLLGAPALDALAVMADRLIAERKLTVTRVTLAAWTGGSESERLIQRLISQQVLSEPHPGTIAFSHQTLLDCLAVHAALARGETLLTFIKAKLPVPFIRPTVRVFFFYLRAQDPPRFWQQVRAALNDPSLAYHLRRLIAESIAEITPSEEDWPPLRWLLRDHPNLFAVLLAQTHDSAWLMMLRTHVLPIVRSDAALTDPWVFRIAVHLRTWLRTHPAEVLATWRELWEDFHDGSPERPTQVIWSILSALDAADVWQTPGVRELLESFLDQFGETHPRTLGRAISSFVRATNDGDDLLWRFLTPRAEPDPLRVHLNAGDTVTLGVLRFDKHDLPDGFLQARLADSDWLLDRFVETVLSPDSENCETSSDGWIPARHLGKTSYRRRHVRGVMLPYDSEHFLLDVLEEALKTRAVRNDAWWREHEPSLRLKRDLGLRYLLIQAYRSNPEANGMGATAQLCDADLLREPDLRYELGMLTRDVYPYLVNAAQERHQQLVIALHQPELHDDWWDVRARRTYEFLQWVPRPFRLPEAQRFLDTFEPKFGPALPEPRLQMWDSTEAPPLSTDQLLELSATGIIRLAEFFDPVDTEDNNRYEHIARRHSLQGVFRNAAEIAPAQMLEMITPLRAACVNSGYIEAVTDGVANHLRYRFANVSRAGGQAAREPLPEGETLAIRLLQMLEDYPSLWATRSTASNVAEACAHVILEEAPVARLVAVLARLSHLPYEQKNTPESDKAEIESDRDDRLLHDAINRPRGVAAGAAVRFCNHLIEHERPVPELLLQVIRTFASDPQPSTRVGVLHNLTSTIWARPEIGWPVFELIFQSDPALPGATPAALWKYVEPVLYYQYRKHYERVRPLLIRLRSGALGLAAETYGRISGLCWLAGHITAEEVFASLSGAPPGAWTGIAQVLCTNIESAAHRPECRRGLLHLLRHDDVPIEAISHVAYAFGSDGPGTYFTSDIALALVSARGREASDSGERRGTVQLSGVAEWVGVESSKDPLSALTVVEALTRVLEAESRMSLYNADELVTALSAALREADEMEDQDLLLRVLSVQDTLLRLGVSEVDELLNRAARP
jgi:hypothetical protein